MMYNYFNNSWIRSIQAMGNMPKVYVEPTIHFCTLY